jgi:hypothetical protein
MLQTTNQCIYGHWHVYIYIYLHLYIDKTKDIVY